MAAYLSCITVGGGVPMFTRRVGDLKAVRNIKKYFTGILIFTDKTAFYFLASYSYLFCLQLPFPLLASLNGVALFSQSHNVTLLSTITKDCKLLWRDYHNR